MDSIFKGYPIGALLLWRTREKLDYDRDLGPYTLPAPPEKYPIDYVLDGQQRLTSIFATFQTALVANSDPKVTWTDIYFDLSATAVAQDSQFLALEQTEVDPTVHVPLKVLFDIGEYGRLARKFNDEMAAKIDDLRTRFSEAQVPVETVETEDKAKIAIIFERVNRAGIPLDTYQLLSAWTWNNDFDLRSKFLELSNELDESGFKDLHEDPDLLLRCCAAVITGDASAKSIIDLKGPEVRERFMEFAQGVRGAVEFLRKNCNVSSLKVLPYHSMIIPLVKFFATEKTAGIHPTADQRVALVRWFWQSCFSRRYSNSVDTALSQDIAAVIKTKNGDTSDFNRPVPPISADFFKYNVFNLSSVNTKTFILLLAHERPLSFYSSQPVDLEAVLLSCNRTEFHHVFPKAHLSRIGIIERERQFALANFAFLSQADNRRIKDRAPAAYEADMSQADLPKILAAASIPAGGLQLSFDEFIEKRAELLRLKAISLCT